MITYELIKQLKDAGFPMPTQSSRKIWAVTDKHNPHVEDLIYTAAIPVNFSPDMLMVPSLDELIDACPKKIEVKEHNTSAVFDLCCVDDEWIAWYEAPDRIILSKSETFEGMGSSPEEAVARLWLAINKK